MKIVTNILYCNDDGDKRIEIDGKGLKLYVSAYTDMRIIEINVAREILECLPEAIAAWELEQSSSNTKT